MKWILRFVLSLLLLATLVGVYIETPTGQKAALQWIERKIEATLHAKVTIGRVHCFLPFYFQLEKLKITQKNHEDLLSAASVTFLPSPIPLSLESWLFPYVKIESYRLSLQALSHMSSFESSSSFFLSFPSLHLINGEAADSSLPIPYQFSFNGGLKIEPENLFVEGELLDQTSFFPLHMARGQLSVTQGLPQGCIQCSFKQESILANFRSLFISLEPDQNHPFSCIGSWKLDSFTPSVSRNMLVLASLEGRFALHIPQRSWKVECSSMTLNPVLEGQKWLPWWPDDYSRTPCTGSWSLEGATDKDRISLSIPNASFGTKSSKIDCSGCINFMIANDTIQVDSALSGWVGSKTSDYSFTCTTRGALAENSSSLTYLFSSPFSRIEGEWNGSVSLKKGTFHASLITPRYATSTSLFQSLVASCSYNSQAITPFQLYCHVDEARLNELQVQSIDLNMAFESLSSMKGATDLTLQHAVCSHTKLIEGAAHIEWNNKGHTLSFSANGEQKTIPWETKGQYSMASTDNRLLFLCPTLSGKIGPDLYHLTKEASFQYDLDRGLTNGSLSLELGQGSISLIHSSGFRETFIATYSHCPLLPFLLFLGKEPLKGELDGKTSCTYGGKTPEIHSQSSFQLDIPRELPVHEHSFIEGTLLITTKRTNLLFGITLKDKAANNHLVAEGTLPLLSSRYFPFFRIDEDGPIEGKIQGAIDLATLSAPFHDQTMACSGDLSIHCLIEGTLSTVDLAGEAHLQHGSFLIPHTDALLKHLELDGTFFNSSFIITSITGTGSSGGALSGNGLIQWKKRDFTLQLNSQFRHLLLVDRPAIQIEGEGHVSLLYPNNVKHRALSSTHFDSSSCLGIYRPANLLIKGDATIVKGLIDLSKITSSGTIISQKQPIAPSTVELDLQLEAMNTMTIKSRSFNTLWSSKGTMVGPVNKLCTELLSTCQEGQFFFANRELTVEKGSLVTKGDFVFDSNLSLTALSKLPSCTAWLSITGPLPHLAVTLRSSPPRSEKEILSLLLFNKELSAISPVESLQLANAALNLERKSVGAEFLDTLKNETGLDTITLGASGPNQDDTAIRVGKYLSKGVAVTLSKDISSEANRVGLELNVTDEIQANALVGDDESAVLSLTWKKEF